MTSRILIVDEAVADATSLAARLSAEYYEVATVSDGAQALNYAHQWQPDLVLLGIVIPDPDGFEICRRLKQNEATLHIPVVMVTTLAGPAARLRGLEFGADDVLAKPLDTAVLLARLRGLVRLRRTLDEWRTRGETARALGLTRGMHDRPSVAGARALIVDDDDAGAEMMRAALAEEGILPGQARSEAEALSLAAAISFDLLVISLSLLAEDPLRLAARLRADDATHDTPMLLIAGTEQRTRLLRGFELGANDWLSRPFDPAELRARARNQIRRKFYQDQLRADLGLALEMALTDPLTGLYNQRYLLRHLQSQLGAGGSNSVAVLMIDVDHFKEINDQFGHAAGDQALRQIARTLHGRIRVFDTLARYGGEEFVVVMPATTPEEAAGAAERLRAAIETTPLMPQPNRRCGLTVSIGVAVSQWQKMTGEALMRQADEALYAAKRAGRNRVAGGILAPLAGDGLLSRLGIGNAGAGS